MSYYYTIEKRDRKEVWNGAAFEPWNDANYQSYVVTATKPFHTPNLANVMTIFLALCSVTFHDDVPAGSYLVRLCSKHGAPALDDSVVAKDMVHWGGAIPKPPGQPTVALPRLGMF